MALVLFVAAGLGWIAYHARLQREAVGLIVRAGGKVYYEGQRFDGGEPSSDFGGAPGFAGGSGPIFRTSTGGRSRWLT